MDIRWDPPKARANFAKHGVAFSDAEPVLFDPYGVTIEDDRVDEEQRFVTIGLDALGRILAVVYTYRHEILGLYQLGEPLKRSSEIMKKEYDFSQGKRGPVAAQRGKTRVTIYLDNEVLNSFRARSESEGMGYQTMINQALREYLKQQDDALDEATLRRVIREELQSVGR